MSKHDSPPASQAIAALQEAKEVLGRIFKALKLNYQMADDAEMDGIVVKHSTGG